MIRATLRWLRLAALALALPLSGCLVSLHPLYTDATSRFDPTLVGVWHINKETMTFAKGDDGAYRVTYADGRGHVERFAVHLVNIGQRLYLDFEPFEPPQTSILFAMLLVPAHTWWALERVDDSTFRMRSFNEKTLQRLAAADPDSLRYESVPDWDIVVTSPTAELQAFVARLAELPDAFDEGGLMERGPPDAPPPR